MAANLRSNSDLVHKFRAIDLGYRLMAVALPMVSSMLGRTYGMFCLLVDGAPAGDRWATSITDSTRRIALAAW